MRELKALLGLGDRSRPCGGPQVIAKIEKPEALDALTAIVAAADGVMVARGDLGVEIDIAQVAVAQKRIIAECRRQRKPVIIATQMLDSMQHSRLPTRAEVADVSNAILDGADACMLSGETAVGEYPRETVEMMNRIALAAEPLLQPSGGRGGPCAAEAALASTSGLRPTALNAVTEAVVCQAGLLAEKLDAQADHRRLGQRGDGPEPGQEPLPRADGGRERFGGHLAADVSLLGRHSPGRRPGQRQPDPGRVSSARGASRTACFRRRPHRAHCRHGHGDFDAQYDRGA